MESLENRHLFCLRYFVHECYKMTKLLPQEEKFALCSQRRRAALSVHLNIADSCSRNSDTERKRFCEVARSSIIEIDAALDVVEDLAYCNKVQLQILGQYLTRCFSILSKSIKP